MRRIIVLGIFALFFINFVSVAESNCSSVNGCYNDCNSDCSNGCNSKCQTPCRQKCENAGCRSRCDVKEPEEPEVQKKEETIILPSRDVGSNTSNVNDIKNDYQVNINPNITMTNRITNLNNVSVPINVTSVNVNNIRVSSSDARSTQMNITSRGGADCSGRKPSTDCMRSQKQIVIIPYPQKPQPQLITPLPQPKVFLQPIVRQPIIVQAPQTQTPPPQRIPYIVPTPIIQQVPVPVQPQVIQPMPQYYWFSQQYIRQPQQTVITQPQQQVLYSGQIPCGAPGGQCGSYCLNQPCSTQQIIPMNYPFPSSNCQSGGCSSRMMYALTSPYISSNQRAAYMGTNQMFSRNTLPQYGAIGFFNMKTGQPQIATSFDSRNDLPQTAQTTDLYSQLVNQVPMGLDSYFVPDQFPKYQIQAGNSTEIQRRLSS